MALSLVPAFRVGLAVVVLAGFAAPLPVAWADDEGAAGPLVVTDAMGVEDAEKINTALSALAGKVQICLRSKQAPTAQACECKHADDLEALQSIYEKALSVHSTWDGQTISYKKGTAPDVVLDLPEIQKKVAACGSED